MKNDYTLDYDDSGFEPNQFKIFFSMQDKKYYIQDLSNNFGTIVHIDKKFLLNHGSVFVAGNYRISITFKSTNGNDPNLPISVQIFEGSHGRIDDFATEYYEYTKQNSPISIGRGSDMMIRLSSDGLSRMQCKLECIDDKWYIIDGSEGKPSTNGTWFHVNEPFPLYDKLSFKAGLLLFRIYLN